MFEVIIKDLQKECGQHCCVCSQGFELCTFGPNYALGKTATISLLSLKNITLFSVNKFVFILILWNFNLLVGLLANLHSNRINYIVPLVRVEDGRICAQQCYATSFWDCVVGFSFSITVCAKSLFCLPNLFVLVLCLNVN